MQKKIILGVVLLFWNISFVKSQKTELSKTIESQIDSIFKEYNNATTPGVAVGFIQNGKLLFSKGYGMADLEHNIPIDTNSIFSLASVSKQFTAFAILILEEQGKLSLQDDVRKYLPRLKDYGSIITIEQLINHTSGIRSHLHLLGQTGYISDNVITKKDALSIIYAQEELNFKPNSDFGYSNSGYVLLAEIVEKVSGQPFSIFMKENIFIPLGMNDSFVMDDYHKIVKNRAESYEIENGAYVNALANYSYYGSTGLYTSLIDLSKWTASFGSTKNIHSSIFKKMNELDDSRFGYSLGQFFRNYKGLEQIYHSGGDAGYRTYLGRFPRENAAVFLLSNNNTIEGQSKALAVADIFLATHFIENQESETPSKKIQTTNLSNAEAASLVGTYFNPDSYLVREIILRNDTLIYSRQEQNGRETPLLKLEEENTFQLGNNQNIKVRFDKIDKQESVSIIEGDVEVEYYTKYLSKQYSIDELQEFVGTYYSKELDTKYVLEVRDGTLTVIHPKMSMIDLHSLKPDTFLSSSWQFKVLEFERNENNQIIGFRISSDRAKRVRFEKKS